MDESPLYSEESEEEDMDGAEFEFQEDAYDPPNQAKSPITKEDVLRGLDPQGIPWTTLGTTRLEYRKLRIQQYRNYENLDDDHRSEDGRTVSSMLQEVAHHKVNYQRPRQYYSFENNERLVPSRIVHFQLRNLVWATSAHDVFVAQQNEILHYNCLNGQLTEIIKPVQGKGKLSTGRLQISTMCVHKNVCIAGGFYGDMVCVRVPGEQGGRPDVLFSERITSDENAITIRLLPLRLPLGPCRQ